MPGTLEKLAYELGQFVAGAPDACAIAWDRRTPPRILGAAGGTVRVFGIAPEALIGVPIGELFVGGERAARNVAEAVAAAPVSLMRLLVRVGGPEAGRQFSARLTLRWVKSGTVALVRDLSWSQSETDAILRAADLARFASLLAHEVRNPLSAVKIALQTLERHSLTQPNDLRRAAIAIREVGNIEVLLNEVVEYAKPQSLMRVPLDPRGPVREAVEELSGEWKKRGVEVRIELPERMPPVQADPSRLKVAARLLVRLGALAAEEEGGGEVVVSLRELPAESAGGRKRWQLAVRDPGRTLSPEAMEKAFMPFHPSRARGSGLALAVVERIAREHGGTVQLSATSEGGGNQVAILLPQD